MNALPEPPSGARHIPDFPGYAVDHIGRVFSCLRTNSSHYGEWKRRKTYIVNTRGSEYEQIILTIARVQTVTTVHRILLLTFRGPCPNEHESRHLNGRSLDNRLDNLEWGTRQANSDDKRRHGTMQSGARNGQAKLTPEDVTQIRELRATTTLLSLAKRFDVSRSQIKRIVYGLSW